MALRSAGAIQSDSINVDPTPNIYTGLQTIRILGIGATPANNGLYLVNPSAAAAAAQQYSPSIELEGQGWKTDATAASQKVNFRMYVQPVQGAANPTGNLLIDASINSAAYANKLSLSSAGLLSLPTGQGIAAAASDASTLLFIARNALGETQTVLTVVGAATVANSYITAQVGGTWTKYGTWTLPDFSVAGRIGTRYIDGANSQTIDFYATTEIEVNRAIGFTEMTAPVAKANQARLFAQDNGAGKTQLMVLMPTGAAIQLAIEA